MKHSNDDNNNKLIERELIASVLVSKSNVIKKIIKEKKFFNRLAQNNVHIFEADLFFATQTQGYSKFTN